LARHKREAGHGVLHDKGKQKTGQRTKDSLVFQLVASGFIDESNLADLRDYINNLPDI
jgi:hypothetical protein